MDPVTTLLCITTTDAISGYARPRFRLQIIVVKYSDPVMLLVPTPPRSRGSIGKILRLAENFKETKRRLMTSRLLTPEAFLISRPVRDAWPSIPLHPST
jgi:hypothetical protein